MTSSLLVAGLHAESSLRANETEPCVRMQLGLRHHQGFCMSTNIPLTVCLHQVNWRQNCCFLQFHRNVRVPSFWTLSPCDRSSLSPQPRVLPSAYSSPPVWTQFHPAHPKPSGLVSSLAFSQINPSALAQHHPFSLSLFFFFCLLPNCVI